MTTPTEQFSQLSLPDDMRFAASTLEQRKKRVRAILASFDRDQVPSRYKTDIYARIDEEQSRRSPAEWVIGDDFEGSLMQKGCHDPAVWLVLNDLEPAEVRVRKFGQKINRLFKEEFQRYEEIVSQEEERAHLRGVVLQIAQNMRMLSRAAYYDLEDVSDGLKPLAQALTSALHEVCKRSVDVLNVRRSGRRRRRSSAEEPKTSLYHLLIHDPPAHEPLFLLDAFEAIKAQAPRVLAEPGFRGRIQGIRAELLSERAPTAYRDRFVLI